MNRNIIKALLCSALAVPVLTSCELDQYPDTYIPTEQSWQTLKDAENYNNGILASIRGISYGAGSVGEVQTDLFNLRNTAIDYYQVHTWTFTNTQFDGDGLWSGSYNVISNANNVINNIDKVKVETEAERQLLNKYKANAIFARAFAYANMVPFYCENYDESKEQLGLPIIKTVDVNRKPKRSSLKETYEFIISDLTEARKLYADKEDMDYTSPNYNVAEALQARVLLNMGKNKEAVDTVNDLLTRYSLITNKTDYQNMWQNDIAENGKEILLELQMTPDDRAGFYGAYESWNQSTQTYNPSYIPTKGLLDLYERSDYRRAMFFTKGTIEALDQVADGYVLNKFPGNEALRKSNDGERIFYNMPKAFRVSELYLIAAEATNKLNGGGADYLSVLRQARGLQATTVTGDALMSLVKDEWAREYVGEGQRFICLKRWNAGFTRMKAQSFSANILSNQTGAQGLEIKPDNRRFLWEIPAQDLQANPNLERNWK